MPAVILDATDEGIAQAASNLKAGGIVAFATETVYGLGANALIEDSVREIFRVKGRPLTDPLIVHVPSMNEALELVELEGFEKHIFQSLGNAFWPGGLTLIAKQKPFLPLCLSAGTGYVGIRVPNHALALRLLREAGCPVAAPSANRFGHVSPTTHEHVFNDLGGHNITILNGDAVENTCQHGIESTVCKMDVEHKELIIFRRGAISESQISQVLQSLMSNASSSSQNEQYDVSDWKIRVITKHVPMPENYKHLAERSSQLLVDNNSAAASRSDPQVEEAVLDKKEQVQTDGGGENTPQSLGEVAPGQLITHYAPDVATFILRCQGSESDGDARPSGEVNVEAKDAVFSDQDEREELMLDTVVLDFAGSLSWLADKCLAYQDISPNGDVASAGKGLFKALRWSETVIGAKRVLIADIEAFANGHADSVIGGEHAASVSDRTFRAASGRVILVAKGCFPDITN